MGFAFPKEEREALVASDAAKFLLPPSSDVRYNWVCVRLDAIDRDELVELVLDAWRMVVPRRVAATYASDAGTSAEKTPRIAGRWRIVEMDLWDRDAIELIGAAFIEINADGTGRFRFIAVEGVLDCRHAEPGPGAATQFTWDGDDDGDHAFGRGWVRLEADGSVNGHIFFHGGDDSGFRAVPSRRAGARGG